MARVFVAEQISWRVAVEGQGADFRMGAKVAALVMDGRRAASAHAALADQRFDTVAPNADFAAAATLLAPGATQRRRPDLGLAAKQFSLSTCRLLLGPAAATPSFYEQNACETGPELAPPGHFTLYVLVPVGNLGNDAMAWQRLQAEYRASVLVRLQRIDLGNVQTHIRFKKMLTPVDLAGDTPRHQGAGVNLAHSVEHVLNPRRRNWFGDINGVSQFDDGTHPGSLLPVVAKSTGISCKLRTEDLQLPGDFSTGLAGRAQHDFVPRADRVAA